MRSWLRILVIDVAVWAFIALFFGVSDYLFQRYWGESGDLAAALRKSGSFCSLWVILTPICIWFHRRVPLAGRRVGRFLAVHVPASIGAAVAHVTAFTILWTEGFAWWSPVFLTHAHFHIAVYWIITGGTLASRYYAKYHQREAQLARAELHALKAQLHPHFLFNTLNTISSLIREQPMQAEAMLARLGDLLRITLREHGTDEVPLADELAFVDRYLEIEQARFGDRLRVARRIDAEALDARVPHLLLQPLVENAVRHGLGPRLAGGTIAIHAERRAGALALEVRDDGVGAAAVAAGVGLANTRARLEQLYGPAHRFETRSSAGAGFAVHIELPYRTGAA